MLAEFRAKIDYFRAIVWEGTVAEFYAAGATEEQFGHWAGEVFNALTTHYGLTPEQAVYFSLHAVELIECDYEPLCAALTVDEALSENAPLVHEHLDSYRLNTVLERDWHPVYGTNIAHQASFSKGDIDRGFAEADEIFDDTFRSQQVQHCSLEPHGKRFQAGKTVPRGLMCRPGSAAAFGRGQSHRARLFRIRLLRRHSRPALRSRRR